MTDHKTGTREEWLAARLELLEAGKALMANWHNISLVKEQTWKVIVSPDEEFLTYNQGVIKEFRANDGVVTQLGFPILLLTTTGARTGRSTTTPLGFSVDNGRVFVVASNGGAPTNPAWFRNLRSTPAVTVELGGKSYPAQALVLEGAERDRLYALIYAQAPTLAGHEKRTDRIFPTVVLDGVPAPAQHLGSSQTGTVCGDESWARVRSAVLAAGHTNAALVASHTAQEMPA
jgi:deazaflavin-dependent oxidoreductase (nitroreductase family)